MVRKKYMSEYSKKLHIKYNNVQTDIKLYTTTNEGGSNYIGLYDGVTNTYAKLDTSTGTNLHIKKNGTVYNIIKEIASDCPTGYYYNFDALKRIHEPGDTCVFTIPAGVKIIRHLGCCNNNNDTTLYASVTTGKSYTITTKFSPNGIALDIQINGKSITAITYDEYIDYFYYSPEINTYT